MFGGTGVSLECGLEVWVWEFGGGVEFKLFLLIYIYIYAIENFIYSELKITFLKKRFTVDKTIF